MMKMSNRYAGDLLKYAKEKNQLEEIYMSALILTQRTDWSEIPDIPGGLAEFLQLVPQTDTMTVLSKFIEIARGDLGLLDVTVISAVQLTSWQMKDIEKKLVRIFNKRIHMVTKVDSSLLGGLRIIAGYTVIDNTIKKKLIDMKKNIYKGVYLNQ